MGGVTLSRPDGMERMAYYFLFLGIFAARKVLDQVRSRRNVRRLEGQRQILPSRDRALPWMLLAHLAFFVLTPLEIVLLGRNFLPWLGIPMIVLFVLATLLRWWATSLLKEQWSSRVVVPEDLTPVCSGPYRVVRHPNYLAVSLELLAAGLMFSAYLSTAFVGVLNLCAIIKRIHTEEEVLFQVPAYRAAMADKARLIPGIY
jgi:methyltransferase